MVKRKGDLNATFTRFVSPLLIRSYSEVLAFPHKYRHGRSCSTHSSISRAMAGGNLDAERLHQIVSDICFHEDGRYLAASTIAGCLTVHRYRYFENMQPVGPHKPSVCEYADESGIVIHADEGASINAVCWNPFTEHEVSSISLGEVLIHDVAYITELRKTFSSRRHLTDIVYHNDHSVLISDTVGKVSICDKRAPRFQQSQLTTNAKRSVTSIQHPRTEGREEHVYGANEDGLLFLWDIRVNQGPLEAPNLSNMLNMLGSSSNAQEQQIRILNIRINPSNTNQLGFHLADGRSGVYELIDKKLTHLRTPPRSDDSSLLFTMRGGIAYNRKPAWLPNLSIFVVPSDTCNGIDLLDFFPTKESPHHVDHVDGAPSKRISALLRLSGPVTACAAHPHDSTIIAGTTRDCSLLFISQKPHPLVKEGNIDAPPMGTDDVSRTEQGAEVADDVSMTEEDADEDTDDVPMTE